jgi:UDP-N-acetylmuramoyl-tripeptide--D-alanyl-D-alanine ligase
MFLTLNDVRNALSFSPVVKDIALTGVSTDTRTLTPGMLFVALRGENFDGHAYIAAAYEKGAATALVEHSAEPNDARTITVYDTLTSFGKIASLWRSRFDIPVVAVTGSVGKTTMKEMISLSLFPFGPVLKTEKNENNEIGLPQTLLRLNDTHRALVVEMGMRGKGQIKYLAEIAKPTVAVISLIGESHIEIVGSRENIADAKGELIESLTAGGTAVLNADDPFFGRLAAKTKETVISFGTSVDADVRVLDWTTVADTRWVSLDIGGVGYELFLHSPALHDIMNAAGAIAAAVAAGVPPQDAVRSVEAYRTSNMRMEIITSKSGATILSDCYNAAPTSVKSALSTLADYQKVGPKTAFLGDMRELGEFAAKMHRDVAEEANKLGIDNVIPVGEIMGTAFPKADKSFINADDAAHFVEREFSLSENDVVLVKGSRALQMEKVVEALVRR